MSRINTNVSAMTAQIGLARAQKQQNTALQRLSTGLKINSGADDPAGLIASENLRSQMSGIQQGIDNSTRATNVLATAEGALNEVSALLLNIKSLVVEAANSGALSPEEIQANQLQVDSAVDSITRIANTTNFAGLKLLNGNLDYLTSGVDSTVVGDLRINQANFGTNASIPVSINVLTSAKPAVLTLQVSSIVSSVSLQLTGTEGVTSLAFVSGTKSSAIAFAINRITDQTGLTAHVVNAANASSGIAIESTKYGSRNFAAIKSLSGTFSLIDPAGATVTRTVGADATATINGVMTVGDGLDLTLNSSGLQMDLTLQQSFGIGSTSFAVTGGGAMFQLGAQVNSNQQVNLGIGSVSATDLGNAQVGHLSDIVTGGSASLTSGNAQQAEEIIEAAVTQVAVLRGRIGAFEKNVLETNVNSLQIAMENVTSSESSIRDSDFAMETSALTRAQILTQAGTSVLSTANSTPKNVLTLLQQ